MDFEHGVTVAPPWNEIASHASVADTRDQPGQFLPWRAASTPRPRILGRDNHKTVVPSGATDRICGYQSSQGKRQRCENESALYRWSAARNIALIQAHPGAFTPFQAPWHPLSEPRGLSDAFVYGIEISSVSRVQWEDGYRAALDAGYRFFPAFGSDLHHLQGGVPDCGDGSAPTLADGASICWTSDASWDRAKLVGAMRDRACFVSRAWKPELQMDACARPAAARSCSGAPIPMGGLSTTPTSACACASSRETTCATRPTPRAA